VDNIFIIRTVIGKYLRNKRGRLFWLSVDLQKIFDTVVRDALWWQDAGIIQIHRSIKGNV
jgi:hypothetical protein